MNRGTQWVAEEPHLRPESTTQERQHLVTGGVGDQQTCLRDLGPRREGTEQRVAGSWTLFVTSTSGWRPDPKFVGQVGLRRGPADAGAEDVPAPPGPEPRGLDGGRPTGAGRRGVVALGPEVGAQHAAEQLRPAGGERGVRWGRRDREHRGEGGTVAGSRSRQQPRDRGGVRCGVGPRGP